MSACVFWGQEEKRLKMFTYNGCSVVNTLMVALTINHTKIDGHRLKLNRINMGVAVSNDAPCWHACTLEMADHNIRIEVNEHQKPNMLSLTKYTGTLGV